MITCIYDAYDVSEIGLFRQLAGDDHFNDAFDDGDNDCI